MEIKKVKLSKENLKIIKSIDEIFYKDDRLTLQWYIERYNENHDGILLINEENINVGYLVCVPIKEELYNQFVTGMLSDDVEVDPQMFIKESKYNYIVSTVIFENYRRKGYGTKMLEELMKDSDGKNYCAISVSSEGYKLLKKKLDVTKKVNDTVYAFEKKC